MNTFFDHNVDTKLISIFDIFSIGPLASSACCRPRLPLYALITAKQKKATLIPSQGSAADAAAFKFMRSCCQRERPAAAQNLGFRAYLKS